MTFQTVKLQTVAQVKENPNLTKLDVIEFDNGYVTVASKGKYSVGDTAWIIPADSVLTDEVRDALELKENRVKAIKIRGVVCDCVAIPAKAAPESIALAVATAGVPEDVGECLCITKYRSAPIEDRPEQRRNPRKNDAADTRGQEADRTSKFKDFTVNYDIKNVRHFPFEFDSNEQVVVTEKVHGSWFQVCATPLGMFVTSKGLAGKGIAFNDEASNLWTRAVLAHEGVRGLVFHFVEAAAKLGFQMVAILGEVYGKENGKGVQDLTYGKNSPDIVVFDIAVGNNADDMIYLTPRTVEIFCDAHGVPRVPVVYRGDYDPAVIEAVTKGRSIIDPSQIREGVVIRSATGARSYHLPGGRKILKSINPAYLARGKSKDGEEPTESQ